MQVNVLNIAYGHVEIARAATVAKEEHTLREEKEHALRVEKEPVKEREVVRVTERRHIVWGKVDEPVGAGGVAIVTDAKQKLISTTFAYPR